MAAPVSGKERIDTLLVRRGLAPSRERARALVLAGKVLVRDAVVDKPGTLVDAGAEVRLRGADLPYVGRGGLKLEGALQDLGVDPLGLVCLDVGASTGGFTDCLLQRGAAKVYAVDVGTAQLAWKLRADPRVVSLERTDVRTLDPSRLAEPVDLAVIDASFISLRGVLPPAARLVRPGGRILALAKPQFEVGRARVGKRGVVRDEADREAAFAAVRELAEGLDLLRLGEADSRLPGAKSGNVERFFLLARPKSH
ncbi:TlyA family RNA methyltransferase [Myxococcota bacterium]|nr:TlyA family RNA methyltransferase [Myxococcota bacterium]